MSGREAAALRWALGLVTAVQRWVPRARRAEWRKEWHAEIRSRWLAHEESGGPSVGEQVALVLRSLGALSDAAVLRWHGPRRSVGLDVDMRHAWRGLARRPAYSGFVVLVLALGLGAGTAAWTVVRDVLLEPLPYPDADRVVMLWDENPSLGIERSGPTPANVLDWRRESRAFSGLAAYYSGEPLTLEAGGEPRMVATTEVTADFFGVLAQPPRLGRVFSPDEVAEGSAVTVLSHRLWRERFGGDPNLVGREVRIGGESHRVIGVMPPSFAMPDRETALWLPWDFERAFARLGHVPRDYRYLRVVARLAPGVELARAQEEMDRIAGRLSDEHTVNRGWGVRVVPYRSELLGDLRRSLWALAGAVAFVLLIATINAGHLVAGRLAARRSELAMRGALGASRFELSRLVVLEAALLSLASGLAAVVLAQGMVRGLIHLAPAGLPRLSAVAFDGASVAAAAVLTLATAAVLGLVAMAGCRRPTAAGAVAGQRGGARGVGRSSRRWSGGLVITQIGSAFALVVLALLALQSLRQVLSVDPGFSTERLLVARVFPDAQKFGTVGLRLAYFDELFERLRALPGVESVGAGSGLPMNSYNNTPSCLFSSAEQPVEEGGPEAVVTMATVGYLETLGRRLVEGRHFDERDHLQGQPVVIVSETLARRVWPDGRAIGRTLRLRFGRDRDQDFAVVGVVSGARSESLKSSPPLEAFRPHAQAPYVTMNVILRTGLSDPTALAPSVRAAALAIDPTQPVHSITTVEQLVGTTLAPDRLSMWLLAGLALLALLLAAAGVYGVMAHAVRLRAHEIGVRMALGATPGGMVGRVLGTGLVLLALGVVLGGAASLGVSRVLAGMLYGIEPGDLPTLALAAACLAGAVLAACCLPAARAARVDPATTLRALS